MPEPEENSEQRESAAGDIPSRLAKDEFYRALADVHRRRVLWYLLENGQSTEQELASVLRGWELNPRETMSTPADRSEIRLQLLHSHLPRLDDAGLIGYDEDTGTVGPEPVHPRVRAIIRQSVEAEPLDVPE